MFVFVVVDVVVVVVFMPLMIETAMALEVLQCQAIDKTNVNVHCARRMDLAGER